LRQKLYKKKKRKDQISKNQKEYAKVAWFPAEAKFFLRLIDHELALYYDEQLHKQSVPRLLSLEIKMKPREV